MKRMFTLIFLISFLVKNESFSQDCLLGTSTAKISTNKSTATFSLSGELWSDDSSGGLTMKNDQGIETPVLRNGGIWIGGLDLGGNLKIAASTYGFSSGQTDFFPGPLDQFQGITNIAACQNWDRFFRVTKEEIKEHQRKLNDQLNGIPYTEEMVPEGIKNWPARGNPHFENSLGFKLPDEPHSLADYNEWGVNNKYEPLEGDYPTLLIKRNISPWFSTFCNFEPDEMLFWIINDTGGIHSETGGASIQIEIQITAFVFKDNEVFDDAVFYKYKLINRGVEDFISAYFGVWTDTYQCNGLEKFGCDTSRNLVFRYNQESLTPSGSDQCECGGNLLPCEKMPVLGTTFFKRPTVPTPQIGSDGLPVIDPFTMDTVFEAKDLDMSSFNYYKNAAFGNPLRGTTDPQTPQEYYNYLKGQWRDGSPLQNSGDGHNTGEPITKFVFPDPPNCISPDCWSMCSEDLGENDLRALQSIGPMNLKPGHSQAFIIGTFSAEIDNSACPDISPLQRKKDLIQGYFDDCFSGHFTKINEFSSPMSDIIIYPNPSFAMKITNIEPKSVIRIFNLSGKQIANLGQAENESLTWSPPANLAEGIYFVEVRNEAFGKRVLKWIFTK